MSTVASYSSATIGSITAIDVNHPYYIHPSDNPGLILTTVLLDEHNYSQWQRAMDIALSSKFKIGFVDGTYTSPPSTSNLYGHWNRCNNMVTSWLLNSVTETIRNSIQYMKSAKAIWDELRIRYAQTNVPKLFALRKELSHLSQDSLSISAYFTKYRTLQEELSSMTTSPRCCGKCTCTINAQLDAHEQSLQLEQFLMGLNDTFTSIRGQILLMNPLPSLSKCYSILLQEENQRGIASNSHPSADSVTLAVKSKTTFVKGVKKAQSDVLIYCDYCHMQGHAKDKCFCLHGYPEWHKMYGKPKPKPKHLSNRNAVAAQVSQSSDNSQTKSTVSQSDTSTSNFQFSESQYKQLLQLLNHTSVQPTAETNPYATVNSTQFAGTFLHFASHVHNNSYKDFEWIVDTGATDHVTPHLHLLSDIVTCQSLLYLPNGHTAPVTHMGSISINSHITLHNVLCVPQFHYNLFSVSKFVTDSVSSIVFKNDCCFLQAPTLMRDLEIGKAVHGLYILNACKLSSTSSCSAVASHSADTNLWHARTGHVPLSVLKLFPFQCKSSVNHTCDICHLSKQVRNPFANSESCSSNVFDLVHMDLWGPYRIKTHGSCSYFLTIVDDMSRAAWVFLLPDKIGVSRIISDFLSYVINQFKTSVF